MKAQTILTLAGAVLIIGAGFVGEKAKKPILPVSTMIVVGTGLVIWGQLKK